jgi:hypothetical protein
MVDEVQQQRITEENAMAFLRDRSNGLCTICGSDNIEAIVDSYSPPPDNSITYVMQMHLTGRSRGFFPTVAFVCIDCGCISQFWWETVFNWIESQG